MDQEILVEGTIYKPILRGRSTSRHSPQSHLKSNRGRETERETTERGTVDNATRMSDVSAFRFQSPNSKQYRPLIPTQKEEIVRRQEVLKKVALKQIYDQLSELKESPDQKDMDKRVKKVVDTEAVFARKEFLEAVRRIKQDDVSKEEKALKLKKERLEKEDAHLSGLILQLRSILKSVGEDDHPEVTSAATK